MAIIRSFAGDGLSAGTLTTSTAGTGDNAFNLVGTGWSIITTGDRAPAVEFTKPAGASSLIHWTSLGDKANYAYRVYFTLSALPSGTLPFILTSSSSADARSIDLSLTSSGGLRVYDSANTLRDTFTGLAVATLYRVEAIQTPTDTTVRLFLGHSSTPIDETTYSMTGVPLNRLRIGGNSSSITLGTAVFDDIAVADTATWIGPSAVDEPSGPVERIFSGDGLTVGAMTTSTAGSGDNAFNLVGTGWAIVNSGARAPSIEFTKPADAASLIHWTGLGDATDYAYRVYFTLNGFPSATLPFILTSSSTADARSVDLSLTSTGGIRVYDSANTLRGTLAGISLSTLYRVELIQTPTDTTVRLYLGHSATVLDEVTYALTGVPLNRFRLGGNSASVSISPILFDDIAVRGESEWIGPSVAPVAPRLIYAWSGTEYFPLSAIYRWNGSSYVLIETS